MPDGLSQEATTQILDRAAGVISAARALLDAARDLPILRSAGPVVGRYLTAETRLERELRALDAVGSEHMVPCAEKPPP